MAKSDNFIMRVLHDSRIRSYVIATTSIVAVVAFVATLWVSSNRSFSLDNADTTEVGIVSTEKTDAAAKTDASTQSDAGSTTVSEKDATPKPEHTTSDASAVATMQTAAESTGDAKPQNQPTTDSKHDVTDITENNASESVRTSRPSLDEIKKEYAGMNIGTKSNERLLALVKHELEAKRDEAVDAHDVDQGTDGVSRAWNVYAAWLGTPFDDARLPFVGFAKDLASVGELPSAEKITHFDAYVSALTSVNNAQIFEAKAIADAERAGLLNSEALKGALVVFDADGNGTADTIGAVELVAHADDEVAAASTEQLERKSDPYMAARLAKQTQKSTVQLIAMSKDGRVERFAYVLDDEALKTYVQLVAADNEQDMLVKPEETTPSIEEDSHTSEDTTVATGSENSERVTDEETNLGGETQPEENLIPADEEAVVEEVPEASKIEFMGLHNVLFRSMFATMSESVSNALAAEDPSGTTTSNIVAGTPTTDQLTIKELTLTTGLGSTTEKNPSVENNVFERFTGESIITHVNIDRTDVDDNSTKRIYIQFSAPKGQVTGSVIYTPSDEPYYFDDAKTRPYYFKKAEGAENTYYFEIPAGAYGATQSLEFRTMYPSPDSGGGQAQIWAVNISPENAAASNVVAPADGHVHEIEWSTLRDEYTTRKQASNRTADWESLTNPPFLVPGTVMENGEEKEVYFVSKFGYYIDTTVQKRTGIKTATNGLDLATSTTYVDTVELPEGMRFNPELLEQAGIGTLYDKDWSYYSSPAGWTTKRYLNYYVFFYRKNNKSQNAIMVGDRTNLRARPGSPFSLKFLDERHVQVTLNNGPNNYDNSTYRPTSSYVFSFYDGAIIVDNPLDENGEKKTFTIHNDITGTTNYTYSEPSTTSASLDLNVALKESTLKFNKSHKNAGNLTLYRGNAIDFTLTANVDGSFDMRENSIADPLPNMYYMSPDQIIKLFSDKDHGKDVSLTINGVRTINNSGNGEVTTASGGTGTTSYQYYQPGAEYSRPSYGPDDNTTGLNETISIAWNEDKSKLVVTSGSVEKTIDVDASALKKVFDELGFVIQYQTIYNLVWQIPGGILPAQTTSTYTYSATAKDSFMLARTGNLVEGKDEDQFMQNQVSVQDQNVAHISGDQELDAIDSATTAVNDFKVQKSAQIDGKETFTHANQDDQIATPGQVTTYHLNLTRTANDQTADFDALPLVDELSGVHVLRAPAIEANAHLAQAPYNLELKSDASGDYYELVAKDGAETTYKNVTFAGTVNGEDKTFTADAIRVTPQGDTGTPTVIEWFLHTADYPKNANIVISYDAGIDIDRTGYDPPAGTKAEVSNTMMLGGLQSQRLWDQITYPLAKLGADKKIVLDKRDTSNLLDDNVVASTKLDEGVEVTYRLGIKHVGADIDTLDKNTFWDELPMTVASYPWTKGTSVVSVEFPEGQPMKVEGADSWHISDTAPDSTETKVNQQYLVFGDGFKLDIWGDSYIYITLKYPEGDAWEQYITTYSKDGVQNIEHVNDRVSKVFHVLGGPVQAMLQKGVVETGTTSTTGDSFGEIRTNSNLKPEARRQYIYSNGTVYAGYTEFYVVIANDGPSRLYLSEIQDVLPQGYSYLGGPVYGRSTNKKMDYTGHYGRFLVDAEGAGYTKASFTPTVFDWKNELSTYTGQLPYYLQSSDGKKYTAKNFGVHVQNQGQLLRFTIDNYYDSPSTEGRVAHGNLSYDADVAKYYLSPGEYIGFTYYATSKDATDDTVTNTVGMPFYDRGTGVVPSSTSVVSTDIYGLIPNDGTRSTMNSAQASTNGLRPTESGIWLVSTVDQEKPPVVPGIQKQVISKTHRGETTAISNPSYAAKTDTITWKSSLTTQSAAGIRNYAFVDIIDAPFIFTGAVKMLIKTTPNSGWTSAINAEMQLLEFKSWNTSDGNPPTAANVTSAVISTGNLYTWSTVDMTLEVNGNPILVRAWNAVYSVSLQRTNDGRLRFTMIPHSDYFTTDGGTASLDIPIGAPVEISMSTVNNSSDPIDNVLFNEAYLVPLSERGFDKGKVTVGSPTDLDVKNTLTGTPERNTGIVSNYSTDTYNAVVTSAMIPMNENAATSSIKHVQEKPVGGESAKLPEATSTSTPNYITLKHPYNDFTYTLDLHNEGQEPISRFTFIDGLPEVGDHYPFKLENKRYSQFDVAFANSLNLQLQYSDGEGKNFQTADPSTYKVYLSDKTEFVDADWNPETTDTWVEASYNASTQQWELPAGTKLSDMRSLRVTMVDGAVPIVANATARVIFDAHVATLPEDGGIAWNSFGYRAVIGQSGTLDATPLKVGVRVDEPWQLRLTKISDTYYPETGDPVKISDGTQGTTATTQTDALLGAKHLGGTVLGLYSPLEPESMDDESYTQAVTSMKLLKGDVPRSIQNDGTTYYLHALQMTDSADQTLGSTLFTGLRARAYVVRELKAPEGYTMTSPHQKLIKRSTHAYPLHEAAGDTQETTTDFLVNTEASFILPNTGGNGILFIVGAGTLLTLVAYALNKYKQVKQA